jgi:zinc protease
MKILIFFLALSLLAGPSALASPGKGLPVFEDSLSNGLKVLVCEKRDAPVVSVQIWYRVGSRHERPGLTGISHLLEHMMFKGGEGPEQFNDAIQKRGGRANAFTSEDYTCYHEEVSHDHWEMALEMEAGRMSRLAIDSLEFETERQVVLEERRLGENSPNRALMEELESAAYRHHPYGWPVIGFAQDIKSITLADLRKHYRTYYRPDNAICVLTGDLDRLQAMAAVSRCFGGIPRPGDGLPPVNIIEPKQNGERRVQLRRPSGTAFLCLAYHTVAVGHPDSYALDILANILSDGESSRLYRRLVREQGLASYARGYHQTGIDPTLFTFYAAPALGHSADELEAALLREIDDIKARGVSDWEMNKAKNQIESQLTASRQRAYGLGIQLGSAQARLSWRHIEDYLHNVSLVKDSDILRVAKKYFSEDNRTVAVLVPENGKMAGGGQ